MSKLYHLYINRIEEHAMNNAVDLHVHSTFSDGTYTPKELVALAAAKELRAMALTDHDTVAGVPEALAAASAYTANTRTKKCICSDF